MVLSLVCSCHNQLLPRTTRVITILMSLFYVQLVSVSGVSGSGESTKDSANVSSPTPPEGESACDCVDVTYIVLVPKM